MLLLLDIFQRQMHDLDIALDGIAQRVERAAGFAVVADRFVATLPQNMLNVQINGLTYVRAMIDCIWIIKSMRKGVILMELKSLYCPNCGAAVKPVDGLDTFYCQYCGYQIHLDGMSDEAYKARTRMKQMEHEERMQDKKDAYDKFVFEKQHAQIAKEKKSQTN